MSSPNGTVGSTTANARLIEQRISESWDELSALEGRIDALINRLEPVLTVSPPQPENETGAKCCDSLESPVAVTLDRQSQFVRRQSEKLDGILARLEC